MASVKELTSNFMKLDKFLGVEFRRWQKKMLILLTSLNVAYVISTPKPEEKEDETVEDARKRNKWENDDFICRGHILNGICDSLFDIYQFHESAKLLWDSLEDKYMSEDASSKLFLVSNFNNYKMLDNRPVMDQFHELQRMYNSMKVHGITMDEIYIVSSIIDKLPSSWRDVRHTLKHKKEEITLVELAQHLQVEVSLRELESLKGDNPNL